jgi:hypothetical protein
MLWGSARITGIYLLVYGPNDIIGLGGQESEQPVFPGVSLALTSPGPPNAGKGKRRPLLIQSKPVRYLGTGIRPFTERGRWHQAAVLCLIEPVAPIRALGVPNIGYRPGAKFRCGGKPQRIIVRLRAPSLSCLMQIDKISEGVRALNSSSEGYASQIDKALGFNDRSIGMTLDAEP